jgi:hypothetical protein
MKTLARIISFLTNPLLVLFPLPFLLIYSSGYGHLIALKWTLFSIIFLFIAGLFVLYEVKQKVFSDMDVSKREQRKLLFSVIALIAAIYLFFLYILSAPQILFITVWGVMIGILFASLINTKIKVSLHVGVITAVLLTLSQLYNLPYAIFLIIPLVGWSRIEIRRHSLAEVITGLIFGITLTTFMYILLKYIYNISI